MIVEAEAVAERRRIEAEGEAKAIFAKLEAEARGNYEILAKKAEGLREIVAACGGAQDAFQLLMLEHMEALSETAAQAISNIKFDKVIVWDRNGGNGNGGGWPPPASSGTWPRPCRPMLQIMQDIGGVKMPEYFGKMVGDEPEPGRAEPATNGTSAPPTAETAQETPPPPAPRNARPGATRPPGPGTRIPEPVPHPSGGGMGRPDGPCPGDRNSRCRIPESRVQTISRINSSGI